MHFWTWHQNQRRHKQNKLVGLHKTKNPLHNNGNHQQNWKAARWMEKNTFNCISVKMLVSKVYKNSYNSIAKTQTIWLKSESRIWIDIFPEKTYRWLIGTRKCSASLIIRGMQIQTRLSYYLTPMRRAIIKKTRNKACWEECGKREPSCRVSRDVNWCSHYGKRHGESSKK